MAKTRPDYAEKISDEFNLSERESRRIIDFFLSAIIDDLRDGERIEFRGFGSFRTVINPGHILEHEGRLIPIDPYRRCIFRSSKWIYKDPPKRRKRRTKNGKTVNRKGKTQAKVGRTKKTTGRRVQTKKV